MFFLLIHRFFAFYLHVSLSHQNEIAKLYFMNVVQKTIKNFIWSFDLSSKLKFERPKSIASYVGLASA